MKLIKIEEEVQRKFPDLKVMYTEISELDNNKESESLKEDTANAIEKWKGITREELRKQEKIKAYQDFFRKLKIDHKSIPPAVENLIIRTVAKGNFPNINSIVNICNVVSLNTLIPIGVFDKDKVKGDIKLGFITHGDFYTPVSGSKKELKNTKGIVLRDEEKIISVPCYRDSDFTKVTNETKNVIVLSMVIEEINEDDVSKALCEAEAQLTKLKKSTPSSS